MTDAKKIFVVPVGIYDVSTGNVNSATIYFDGDPTDIDTWKNQMLKAQKLGRRLSYSSEWSGAQRYLKERNSEQELRLVNTAAYTGTVLDFNDETLKEGITLKEDGTIASAKIILGKNNGIVLPHSSAYVKDLDDTYMPLVAHLHGIKDPKRELPNYAYLYIDSSRIKHVVRGDWGLSGRGDGRVRVDANYVPAFRRFAAWLVDETIPENTITPQEYEAVMKKLSGKSILIE